MGCRASKEAIRTPNMNLEDEIGGSGGKRNNPSDEEIRALVEFIKKLSRIKKRGNA